MSCSLMECHAIMRMTDGILVGYPIHGEKIIPLFIKASKNILSYGLFQYDKNLDYTVSCNVIKAQKWILIK